MRIVCWQTILMKYHTLFFRELGKMLENLLSAAVVIGALRVNVFKIQSQTSSPGKYGPWRQKTRLRRFANIKAQTREISACVIRFLESIKS